MKTLMPGDIVRLIGTKYWYRVVDTYPDDTVKATTLKGHPTFFHRDELEVKGTKERPKRRRRLR